jgi:hypothetical protein
VLILKAKAWKNEVALYTSTNRPGWGGNQFACCYAEEEALHKVPNLLPQDDYPFSEPNGENLEVEGGGGAKLWALFASFTQLTFPNCTLILGTVYPARAFKK